MWLLLIKCSMHDTNYIVKLMQTTFYQQHLHYYFNLIIFNEILII